MFSAHSLIPAKMALGYGMAVFGMAVFELGQPSLATEFDCVARLVAGLPVEPFAVTSIGTDGPGCVMVEPLEGCHK